MVNEIKAEIGSKIVLIGKALSAILLVGTLLLSTAGVIGSWFSNVCTFCAFPITWNLVCFTLAGIKNSRRGQRQIAKGLHMGIDCHPLFYLFVLVLATPEMDIGLGFCSRHLGHLFPVFFKDMLHVVGDVALLLLLLLRRWRMRGLD